MKKFPIRPTSDRVIVRPVDEKPETKGGIVLPDSAREKRRNGVVVAVGPGRSLDNGTHMKMSVALGDRVLLSSYGGTEIQVDGETFFAIPDDEIIGVIV